MAALRLNSSFLLQCCLGLTMVCFLSATSLVSAQDRVFDGEEGNTWDNFVNWAPLAPDNLPANVPDTTSENAIIDEGDAWSVVTNSAFTIGNLTVGSDDQLILQNTLSIANSITNSGQISTGTVLTLRANTTIAGGGTITLNSDLASISGTSGITMTNINHAIEGKGFIADINVDNSANGLINANVDGDTLEINPGMGDMVTNTGIIRASDGGTIAFSMASGTVTNNGTFEVRNNSTFDMSSTGTGFNLTNLSGTTLSGGVWIAQSVEPDGSTMSLPSAGIQVIDTDTTVRLEGMGSLIQSDSQSISDTLTTNDGDLVLIDHIMSAPSFTTNSGRISLQDGAMLDASLNANKVNNSGILEGNGTLSAGAVTNNGMISPGLSAGAIDVMGDLTLSSDGTLEIEIGGYSTNEYDFLNVNGTAELGGTLNVYLIDNFCPRLDDEWLIMHAEDLIDGLKAMFDAFNSPQFDGGPIFRYEIRDGKTSGFDVYLVSEQDILLGDVNGDGSVNLLDVAFFVDALTTGTYILQADCNCDGSVNLLDVEPFIEILTGG